MKIGLGLYRNMLDRENFAFARQTGCTHIVAHWVDYFAKGDFINSTDGQGGEWGLTQNGDRLWTVEELTALRKEVESEGLVLEAVENFDPSHWHDVLLDGPRKAEPTSGCWTSPESSVASI